MGLSDRDQRKLAALAFHHQNPGEPVKSIAAKHGLRPETLSRFISHYRLFLVYTGKGEHVRSGFGFKREEVIADVNKGLTRKELCAKYDISPARLARFLYKAKKPERLRKEAMARQMLDKPEVSTSVWMEKFGKSRGYINKIRRDAKNGIL